MDSMNDVWSFCDDTVMNLLCTLMFMVIHFHCGCCLCPFFLQNSNCLSLFVEWKLVTDVENVLNKQNEVDAVSLTLGTFLATNCRSLPRKSQAKELYRDCLRKGILRLAEKNLVQTSACSLHKVYLHVSFFDMWVSPLKIFCPR